MIRIFLILCGLLAGAAAAQADTLRFYNWFEYTSPKLIAKFERETGIKVELQTYLSNEELVAKLRSNPGAYDLVIPSHHFVEVLIREGLIQKLDADRLPEYKNVKTMFQRTPWGWHRSYVVPWQWGTTSFAYRTDRYIGGGRSLREVFEPAISVMGKLQVFEAPEEVINLAHLYLGTEFCSEDTAVMDRIAELLVNQKHFVRVYSSDKIRERLATGETIMAIVWNGEILKGRQEGNKHVRYAFPKEGVVGWMDGLVIPSGAKNVDQAHTFMNFVLRPENIKLQAEYSRYQTAILDDGDAPELNPPPGSPVRFAKYCSPRARQLIESVWERVQTGEN